MQGAMGIVDEIDGKKFFGHDTARRYGLEGTRHAALHHIFRVATGVRIYRPATREWRSPRLAVAGPQHGKKPKRLLERRTSTKAWEDGIGRQNAVAVLEQKGAGVRVNNRGDRIGVARPPDDLSRGGIYT